MKAILLFLTIAFTVVCSAQNISADKQLYEINIFRWAKDASGAETDKIVLINADGSVTYNGEENYMQLDIAAVTDGFTKFYEGEKIVKKAAYGDDEMTEAHVPDTGEQAIHITIVKMEDYMKDKDFDYPSEYFSLIVIPYDEIPTALYQYLSPAVVASLKQMLEE